MIRGGFWGWVTVLGVFCALDTRASVPIVQGMTDETSTAFAIHWDDSARDAEHVSVRAFLDEERPRGNASQPMTPIAPIATWIQSESFGDTAVVQAVFTGLNIHQRYRLEVYYKNHRKDRRWFRTLDRSKQDFRFVMLSCAHDHMHHSDIWETVVDQNPDVIFFLGDNVYADYPYWLPFLRRNPDPEQIWDRYRDTFEELAFYRSKQLIPVTAIWDDHDFGGNDSDSHYPYRAESMRVFRDFFPQGRRIKAAVPGGFASHEFGPGVSQAFYAFGRTFIFLDERSFRNLSPDPKTRTTLGFIQWDWLERRIRSTEGHGFIFGGDQFFGGYHEGDSFEGDDAPGLGRLTRTLAESKGRFVLGSGDVHYSEVQALERALFGYETLEVTSSSIHSFNHGEHEPLDLHRRRRAFTRHHNFVRADVRTITATNSAPLRSEMTFTSLGGDGETFFVIPFTLE